MAFPFSFLIVSSVLWVGTCGRERREGRGGGGTGRGWDGEGRGEDRWMSGWEVVVRREE